MERIWRKYLTCCRKRLHHREIIEFWIDLQTILTIWRIFTMCIILNKHILHSFHLWSWNKESELYMSIKHFNLPWEANVLHIFPVDFCNIFNMYSCPVTYGSRKTCILTVRGPRLKRVLQYKRYKGIQVLFAWMAEGCLGWVFFVFFQWEKSTLLFDSPIPTINLLLLFFSKLRPFKKIWTITLPITITLLLF